MARLLSVNVGLPRDIEWKGRTVHTAVWKSPVHGRCRVRLTSSRTLICGSSSHYFDVARRSERYGTGTYSTEGCRRMGWGYSSINRKTFSGILLLTGRPSARARSHVIG